MLRGKWILENLLGTPPPPPPPNVPPLPKTRRRRRRAAMREQMEQHRANPVCASCHKLMDPLGFALENFDAVGRVADARGRGGHRRVGRAGRRDEGGRRGRRCGRRWSAGPTCSSTTLTEKLLTYALGRGLGPCGHAGRARASSATPATRELPVLVARAAASSTARRSRCGSSRRGGRRRVGGTDGSSVIRRADRHTRRWPHMFITKMSLPRRTFLRGMGATRGAAAARRDGAGADRDGEDRRQPAPALRRGLRAARRDHRTVDAGDGRRRASSSCRSEAARAVPGPAGRGQQPRRAAAATTMPWPAPRG